MSQQIKSKFGDYKIKIHQKKSQNYEISNQNFEITQSQLGFKKLKKCYI